MSCFSNVIAIDDDDDDGDDDDDDDDDGDDDDDDGNVLFNGWVSVVQSVHWKCCASIF